MSSRPSNIPDKSYTPNASVGHFTSTTTSNLTPNTSISSLTPPIPDPTIASTNALKLYLGIIPSNPESTSPPFTQPPKAPLAPIAPLPPVRSSGLVSTVTTTKTTTTATTSSGSGNNGGVSYPKGYTFNKKIESMGLRNKCPCCFEDEDYEELERFARWQQEEWLRRSLIEGRREREEEKLEREPFDAFYRR